MNEYLNRMVLPDQLRIIIENNNFFLADSRDTLLDLAMGGKDNFEFTVDYDIPGYGKKIEATISKCKNGIVVNYPDCYIRRRDPECMIIADQKETDKKRYKEVFGEDFDQVKNATYVWLSNQDLVVLPFWAGRKELGLSSICIVPKNAAFFAAALCDLQGFIPCDEIPQNFKPKFVIYLAPTFRHTHFSGKQVVVHNRMDDLYELFAYNLYPGPSAKKGVYSALIHYGETEGWVIAHGSTVKVLSPGSHHAINIMHEGASGGGKSEMTENIHRELNGRILVATNIVNNEKLYVDMNQTCEIQPVTDDMAFNDLSWNKLTNKLVVADAECGWFLRTNHIDKYGTDPHLENICIHPKEPLIFINYEAVPGSTCLIWEHAKDAPGKACPNPRVILPRKFVKSIIDNSIDVDIRSFGIRTPFCSREDPTYGIIGMLHVLPPALAWIWRLVAPRGFANPSVTDSDSMKSEGVGSYWPFTTGKKVRQANLLLDQILNTPATRYILVPNQHVGAYFVGFMPQWIVREFLGRRVSTTFDLNHLKESKCALLGYYPAEIKVENFSIPEKLLQVNKQPEVGEYAFSLGARVLTNFFKQELSELLVPKLDKLGQQIIECLISNGSISDYANLIPFDSR